MTRRDLFKISLAAAATPALGDEFDGDLSVRMMDGAHRFVERKIAESIAGRARFWNRDFSSRAAYEKSVEPNRARFRKITGVVDARVPVVLEHVEADGEQFVRWPVLEGVHAEGFVFTPKDPPVAHVVVLPDADGSHLEYAAALAANGVEVLAPVLIDLTSRWSGHPEVSKKTDQPHREWIYRQAYHMGRHIIGYEVQKVLAAVDWFKQRDPNALVGVAGYGEGGLIALYAAAADTRIDAALVSAYFDSRQNVASEPIYHNVWSLLREFGDAEIASLIAPRALVIEAPAGEAEFARIGSLVKDGFQQRRFVRSGDGVAAFASMLGVGGKLGVVNGPARRVNTPERQKRQILELEAHVQNLVRESPRAREKFYLHKVQPELADNRWNTDASRPTLDPAKFIAASNWYRDYFHSDVLGRFDDRPLPPNPRLRKIYDREKWNGYEVLLDVFPDLFASGILLVPKGMAAGERRPVVVCQHGRNGVPKDTVEGNNGAYRNFAARLADEGFITFSPHNLYRGEDRYRYLCRKANNVKASLFSFILAQHAQILRWLGTLEYVDPKRIAFYGLSYGGETAVRVPTILQEYALSICSGDFNTWTEKVAATDRQFSFMYSIEWEMPYFDMGSTFDYAEMTYLMLPRPFMVERGHNDRVGRDEWVAHEYAKVKWLYAQYGMGERTEIEYFNGGHTIHGVGTFAFLRKHLNWNSGKA
jgi:dienelactone hydrolase